MKTRIKKIIIAASALLFICSGVSFADSRDDKSHRKAYKAYGHNKAKKHHSDRDYSHLRPKNNHRKGHVYKEIQHHRYYKNDHRRWNKKHFKPKRHHRKRFAYKEIQHHHYSKNHRRRPEPRETVIYKAALKDPKIIFKVIMKERGSFR